MDIADKHEPSITKIWFQCFIFGLDKHNLFFRSQKKTMSMKNFILKYFDDIRIIGLS